VILCVVDDDPVSLEALTFAARLGAVEAVLFGEVDVDGYAARARRVVHDRLDTYAPEAWAQAIVELEPDVVVAPGTDRWHEVLARVAARLEAPLAANVVNATFDGDALHLTRQRWGGSLLEEARLTGTPKLLTVAPHAVEAQPAGIATTIEEFTPTLGDEHFLVRVTRREEPASGTVRLDTARVVVGGGRGVGSKEGFQPLEELAGLLGGAVGGSRVVTNLGWRPHSDQVGQTGARIAPELYIACGVSGAIQHIVGCKSAKRLLVINKDESAPIVARADWAVIGDLHEIVPAIVAELRKNGAPLGQERGTGEHGG
jgi:electron transfer flavoprotein alpha subunit